MMKNELMKHETFKKSRAYVAALLMSALLAVGVCTSVQAANPASKNGIIGGVPCYATLSVDRNATASTNSSLSTYHFVKVVYTFNYVNEANAVLHDTATAQKSDSSSVTATANGKGTQIHNQHATSTHTIQYGNDIWSVELTAP